MNESNVSWTHILTDDDPHLVQSLCLLSIHIRVNLTFHFTHCLPTVVGVFVVLPRESGLVRRPMGCDSTSFFLTAAVRYPCFLSSLWSWQSSRSHHSPESHFQCCVSALLTDDGQLFHASLRCTLPLRLWCRCWFFCLSLTQLVGFTQEN